MNALRSATSPKFTIGHQYLGLGVLLAVVVSESSPENRHVGWASAPATEPDTALPILNEKRLGRTGPFLGRKPHLLSASLDMLAQLCPIDAKSLVACRDNPRWSPMLKRYPNALNLRDIIEPRPGSLALVQVWGASIYSPQSPSVDRSDQPPTHQTKTKNLLTTLPCIIHQSKLPMDCLRVNPSTKALILDPSSGQTKVHLEPTSRCNPSLVSTMLVISPLTTDSTQSTALSIVSETTGI